MNDILSFYAECEEVASQIPNFTLGCKEDVDYDINILANKYCEAFDNNDEQKKNQYICALLVRYEHMFSYYKKKSPYVNDNIILKDWIYDGIQRACKYRNWLKDSALINDERGAEICINNAIDTSRKRFYNSTNKQKRKGFFFDNGVLSLDSLKESSGFEASDTVKDSERYPLDLDLVDRLIMSKNYEDAIILDLLLNTDAYISTKRLNTEIQNLNSRYLKYFESKYHNVDTDSLERIVNKLLSKKGRSLSGFSRTKIQKLQNNSLLKSILMS